MSRKRLAVVLPVAVVALLAASAARPVAANSSSQPVSLEHYFSAMSWPVRMSVLRARSITGAIDGFRYHGDPPFLRQIAARCRHLRAVTAGETLFASTPPKRLEKAHRGMSRAFSAVRAGCPAARRTALTLDDAMARFAQTNSPEDEAAYERADAAAHESLLRFATTIASFVQAVRTWRTAALRYAGALGLRPPRWLQGLPLG